VALLIVPTAATACCRAV